MKMKLLILANFIKIGKRKCGKVMFSDDSSFKRITNRSACNRIMRPNGSNRYDPKYTVNTVKHPDSVMIWGTFSRKWVRQGFISSQKKLRITASVTCTF